AVMSRVPGAALHFATLIGLNNADHVLLCELMAGGDLANFLPACRKAEPRLKLRILLDIAWPMKLLHAASLVHCDLKPHNMLLPPSKPVWNAQQPTVKVGDLGTVRQADAKAD